MDIRTFGKTFYDSIYWTIMHDGVEHAGYMAFLGLLSFFPFIVLFTALSGFLGQAGVSAELVHELQQLMPGDILAVLGPRINEIVSGPPQGLLTVALIGVIWTASSIVEGTRTILNRVYHVHTPPAYILRRLLSLAQMLIFTAALILVMLILVLGPLVWGEIRVLYRWEPDFLQFEWRYLRYVVSGVILFCIIAFSYYTLPNIRQKWVAVVPGTLAVMLGWVGAAEIFSFYLARFNQLSLVYGSLAGIIAALVFLYVISMIYIFGAEFNYHLEKAIGHRIVEKEKVPVKTKPKPKPKARARRRRRKKAQQKAKPTLE